MLGQRHHVGHGLAQRDAVAVNPVRVGPGAAKQAGAGGPADRLLAVRPLEEQTFTGQPVDVGREDLLVPVAAQFRAQVVHGDEENVHFAPARSLTEGSTT